MTIVKRTLCVLIVATFAFYDSSGQSSLPEDQRLVLSNDQRSIVAGLSGSSKIDSVRSLKRRWTRAEKQLVRNYFRSRLHEIGLEAHEHEYKVHLSHVKQSRNPFKGTNLFAIIPASVESSEYIVIGAHYDSVRESPGAMDNATGCAVVYGVGKLIAKMPIRNKNLILVFFDQEETGHAGSYAFAGYVKKKGFNIHSVHTFDMIGWDADGDKNIELELPTPELESLYKRQAQSFGIVAYTTQTTQTDHREFRNAGFNAIGIGGEYQHGDTSPHHHKPTDTIDTVNFDYLTFVTVLVYEVMKELMSDSKKNRPPK